MNAAESTFINRLFWRLILNIWSIITLALIIIDFFCKNQYNDSTNIVSTIYIALLGIYSADKEIDRWTSQKKFISNYLGELFIIFWTLIMVVLLLITIFQHADYQLNNVSFATYISTLGVFAITEKSKKIYQGKKTSK